jgi:Sugar kinases, ribokinase family
MIRITSISVILIVSKEHASGVALIMVDKKAENCISVAGGANNALMPEDLDNVLATLHPDDIVLLQLEIPIQTVCYAIDKAASIGARVILNPAPAASVPQAQLAKLYMITPNETEASLLTGISLSEADFVSKAMHRLHQMGVCNVLMTLGGNGSALLTEQGELTYYAAEKVKAVDTTAAGDTFNGALCVALIEGKSLAESIRFASHAAALSVTRMGAQTSIPSRKEVDEF